MLQICDAGVICSLSLTIMVSTTLTTIAAGQPTSSSTNYHHHHHSTNATGIATSTANSNSNYQKAQQKLQHQQQQQTQHHSSSSTTTAASTASTIPAAAANNTRNSYHHYNSNYSSAYAHKSYEEETGIGVGVGGGAGTDDTNRNLTHQYQQRPSSALNNSEQHHQRGNQANTRIEEPSTAGNGDSSNGGGGESSKLSNNEQQQTAKTARNEIVNLSQALLLSSSPLNDQISLLFPKCRPKHATTTTNSNGSNTNSNSSSIDENITNTSAIAASSSTEPELATNILSENLKSNFVEPDLLSNTAGAGDSPTRQQNKRLYISENFRSPATVRTTSTVIGGGTSAANRNYYRSVNIITQSPPPPSTSSVSSESLSSVTPRISTNPFLCSNDYTNGGGDCDGDIDVVVGDIIGDDEAHNKSHEAEHENSCQEELPVPTYRTFYYHTSSSEQQKSKTQTTTLTRNQQQQPQQHSKRSEDDYHRNEEMPRKRNNYNSGSGGGGNNSDLHGTRSSAQTHQFKLQATPLMLANDNQHQHQLHQHQQQLRQIHTPFNNGGGGSVGGGIGTDFVHPTNHNQNPFIRGENYWDAAANAHQTRHNNITPTNTVLNSPETELPTPIYGATSSSSRRAFHQQAYTGNGGTTAAASIAATPVNSEANIAGNMSRASQQQQQQLYQQHQQQQKHLAMRLARSPNNLNEDLPESFADSSKSNDHYVEPTAMHNASTELPTPFAGHYLHSSLRGGVKDRARELDNVRDKRDVGHFQQASLAAQAQPLPAIQKQQQLHRQPQQQPQTQTQPHTNSSASSARNMTEGRLSMISNGEVVVFDDITESWQNLKVTTDTNAPRLSPTTMPTPNGNGMTTMMMATTQQSKTLQQQNTLTVIDINDELNDRRQKQQQQHKSDEPTIVSSTSSTTATTREHKKFTERTGSILNSPLKSRHGIIDYEGSPRRIGYGGNNTPDDERLPYVGNAQNQRHAANGVNSNNSNSPQQQYPARPGFPQRITSPPRETTPAMIIASYGNHTKYQNESNTQQMQQQPQTQPSFVPPSQQSPIDNNAEDTSNDVSEIGTISDLTTPEVMPAAVNADMITTTAVANTTTSTTPTAAAAASTQNTSGIISALTIPTKSSTFDYLYEFSETRKVLEEFFKCPSNDEKVIEDSSDIDSIDIQYEFHSNLERDDDECAIDDTVEGDNDDDDDDDDGEDVDGVNDEQLELEHENDDEDLQLQLQQQTNQQQNNYYYQQQQQLQAKKQQSLTRYQYTQQLQQQQQEQQLQQQPLNKLRTESSHNKSYSQSYGNNHHQQHQRRRFTGSPLMRDFDFFLDSASRSSAEQLDQQSDGINQNQAEIARTNYRYSPETTDYDSNCGDVDSLSGDVNGSGGTTSAAGGGGGSGGAGNAATTSNCSNYAKFYASSMPVLEDGLSSGHTSDNENNNHNQLNNNYQQHQQQQQQQHQSTIIHHTPIGGGISVLMDMKRVSTNNSVNSMSNMTSTTSDGGAGMAGNIEKLHSISPNVLHESREMSQMRKLESPINNISLSGGGGGVGGILDESIRSEAARLMQRGEHHLRDTHDRELLGQSPTNHSNSNKVFKNIDPDLDALYSINVFHRSDLVQMTPPPPAPAPHRKPNLASEQQQLDLQQQNHSYTELRAGTAIATSPTSIASAISSTLNRNRLNNCGLNQQQQQNRSYQQPPPIPERNMLQRSPSPSLNSPVWLPRHLDNSVNKTLLEHAGEQHSKNQSADEEDIDTDLETDRLLGHQRLDDQGYYEENKSWEQRTNKSRSLLSKISPKQQQLPSTKTRNGYNALLSSTPEIPPPIPPKHASNKLLDISGSLSSSDHSDKSPMKSLDTQDCGVAMGSPDNSNNSNCLKKDVDSGGGVGVANANAAQLNNGGVGGGGGGNMLVGQNHQQQQNSTGNGNIGSNGSNSGNESGSNLGSNHTSGEKKVKKSKNKEGGAVLIEGVLFRAKYLGSTQLVCEGQPTKSTRMMQAEEAVSRIKAPDSDVQPSTEVDLFISTEKIMVLNTDLKEIMMDHALRTISYIADIGDLVVLMARRRFVPQDIDDAPKPNRTPKMICHVFESDEAQFIAQSIGQAFQVAYMEFLKANGIEDHSFVKEMDYQEVLNSQEIFGDELEIFAKKELQKEVVVPKAKGEILGVVIVESGWGSMLPTVVIANLMSSGAAARCGQLNIGDQLIAINGLSLVGLPLSTCQNYIKNTKNQTVVKFTVVPCPPVVEVKIKRPNTKYQLGFSVQNGVICSLLRGGIAERGGVRVGHRIIEINNQSVVAVPHEKIVNLLATSVGEILMKTMPTSMFRLLTGQENPIYI